jgi:YbbR domain-containing protein
MPRRQTPRKDLWLLRGIAVVFSIFLWFAVIGGKKSEVTKEVPLDYRLRDGTVLSSDSPTTLSFRIRGPRAFLKEMEDKEVRIPVDLTDMKIGSNEVLFTETMLEVPLGLEVLSVLPKQAMLSLDQLAKKRVTIRPVLQANLPEGFKIKSVSSNPSTVEILGPKKTLRFIESLPTDEIKIDPSSPTQDFKATLNLSEHVGVRISEKLESIYVSVNMDGPTMRREFSGIPVTVKMGLGKNAKEIKSQSIRAAIQPSTVNFVLEGPEMLVERLETQSIPVWVEVPELKRGRYKLKLLWQLHPQIKVLRRSSDYALVRIP